MFHIFTDLAANLPQDLVDRYHIGIVPIRCFVDGKVLDVSQGFDGPAFYAAMRDGAQTATAMPSLGEFIDLFEPALEKGEDVLYIGISTGISGTVGAGQSVAEELREKYPDRKIVVIDTKAASLGEGLPVLHAARLRDEGTSFDETAASTQQLCDHMYQVFTVEDLDYLRRGGRLHSAVAKIGNALHVKPILWGDADGHIVLQHMNVGRRRALDTLAAKYRDNCTDKSQPVGLAHCDSPADTDYVVKKLRAAGCTGSVLNVCYEPVTGSHVGPGTVALFFHGPHR